MLLIAIPPAWKLPLHRDIILSDNSHHSSDRFECLAGCAVIIAGQIFREWWSTRVSWVYCCEVPVFTHHVREDCVSLDLHTSVVHCALNLRCRNWEHCNWMTSVGAPLVFTLVSACLPSKHHRRADLKREARHNCHKQLEMLLVRVVGQVMETVSECV